jgi:hypothetical protein
VSAWFDHLRNWRNDEFVRTHARPVKAQPGVHVLRTSGDFAIFFRLSGDTLTVLSIFLEDALQAIAAAEGTR